jgi:hypothetical protein
VKGDTDMPVVGCEKEEIGEAQPEFDPVEPVYAEDETSDVKTLLALLSVRNFGRGNSSLWSGR